MSNVTLMTPDSWYRGELNLAAATGAQLRLLDALNFPQRMAQQGSRSLPSIVLKSAVRSSRRGGDEIPCAADLTLRADSIVLGWEEMEKRSTADTTGAWDYEQRHGADRQRVLIHSTNAMRIEALVAGGTHALDAGSKDVTKRFFACTSVVLADLASPEPPRIIPFLALNVLHIEAWGLI